MVLPVRSWFSERFFYFTGKCSNYSAMHRCEGVSVKVGSTSRNDGGYRAFESYEIYEKEFGERPWGPNPTTTLV